MTVAELIQDLQAVPNPAVTNVAVGGSSLKVAVGDFTAGAAEDMFTLTAHGMVSGDVVSLVYESAAGVVTGDVGDTFIVLKLTDNTFQLTSDGTTVVENTADGTAVFSHAGSATTDVTGATEGGIELTDGGTVLIG